MNKNVLTVIIETPKGSGQKYDYDSKLDGFKLNKILPAGMIFPFDFGYIPETKGEDGDPLDVIAMSEITTFTGCAIDCRIIGAIRARQTEVNGQTVQSDRFIGIPVESEQFREFVSINDIPKTIVEQLENFFKNYNTAAGKKFEVTEIIDSAEALKLINK